METSASRIYEAIKEQIIEGRYAPGVRITEQQVAAAFSTSRTPVREAMRLLVADGFVNFKPNSGSVVRKWTVDQMRQLFDVRNLIESEIAAAAAVHITDEQVAELRRLQADIESSATALRGGDTTRIGQLNRQFHRELGRASRHERLVEMLTSSMEMPIVQQTFRRYSPEQLKRSFSHHRELIDALAAHDAAWARSVMSCHIHSAKHSMLASMREQN